MWLSSQEGREAHWAKLKRIHSCWASRKQLSGVQACQGCYVGAHRGLECHRGQEVWSTWYLCQEGHGKVASRPGLGHWGHWRAGKSTTGCHHTPTLLTRHATRARKSQTRHTGTRSPLPLAVSLQRPLLTKPCIMLTVKEKCLRSPVHLLSQSRY